MKKKPQLSRENEKFMREHYGLTPDELFEALEPNTSPSEFDKLVHSLPELEADALDRIHRYMEASRPSDEESADRHSESAAAGDSGTV